MKNFLFIAALVSVLPLAFAEKAHASVINKAPASLGLASGLVGYWTFDGPDVAGTAAYDRSGNNNTGTLTNGPVRKIGRIGQALKFDGSDDYVQVGNPSSLNISGNITVATWFKFSVSQTNRPIVNRWGTDQSYGLFVNSTGADNISFFIRVAEINKGAISNNTYNDGNWHYAVGIFDGSNVRLVIDGGRENITGDATSGPIDTPATNVVFGQYNNLGNPFNGLIDEVRIYNRALTPAEIKRLYNMGR